MGKSLFPVGMALPEPGEDAGAHRPRSPWMAPLGRDRAPQASAQPGASPGKREHFSSLSGPLFSRMNPEGGGTRLFLRAVATALRPSPFPAGAAAKNTWEQRNGSSALAPWDGVIIRAWSISVAAQNSCPRPGTGTGSWAGAWQHWGCAEGLGPSRAPLLGCPMHECGRTPWGAAGPASQG